MTPERDKRERAELCAGDDNLRRDVEAPLADESAADHVIDAGRPGNTSGRC